MNIAKAGVKNGLRRLGYVVQRAPSPAFDPRFSLQLDFGRVVDLHLASRDGSRPFQFLQVGAYDGVTGDPIHDYVRHRGWRGILVEPQPSHFNRLVANYEGAEGLTFVNAAISAQPGTREIYVVADESGAPIETCGDLSTFRAERLATALQGKLGARHPGSRIGTIDVDCTTFDAVLADVTYLDLLQIDAEGYDFELLKLFDFARWSPAIVHFEHRLLAPRDFDDAILLLARHGYRVVREEFDTTAYAPTPPS